MYVLVGGVRIGIDFIQEPDSRIVSIADLRYYSMYVKVPYSPSASEPKLPLGFHFRK
jgi:hypothetical protein